MSHLSRADLLRWRDEGPASERESVLVHLAACDDCGRAYAELIWTAPAESGPNQVGEAAFRARGYATGGAVTALWAALPRPALLAASLAAVALAGALLLPLARQREAEPSDSAIRGGELQPLAPVGIVTGPIEFRWASPIVATKFVVEVRDAKGRLVGSLHSETERASNPSVDQRLAAGERYFWTVTALDAEGSPLISSAPQSFVLSGGGPP